MLIETYKRKKGRDITLLELLKYLFFCYGWHLTEYNRVFFIARIKAFLLGPIVEGAYEEFNDNRYRKDNFIVKEHDEGRKDLISLKDKEFIENVMNKYIQKNSFELSRITQLSDTPWYNTVTEKGMYKEIDHYLIRQYFKTLKLENRIY